MALKKIKLEILGLSSSQSQTGSFALVLGEAEGNRRLPIIIGMFEAQAIAIEIEKIVPNRPMTHDLFKSFANSFHFHVEEIVISDLKEGVFFAKIVCTDGLKKTEVDARPSDAIAVGLRFDAPIFTFENILAEAGIGGDIARNAFGRCAHQWLHRDVLLLQRQSLQVSIARIGCRRCDVDDQRRGGQCMDEH